LAFQVDAAGLRRLSGVGDSERAKRPQSNSGS
jgi:hypothetical protein